MLCLDRVVTGSLPYSCGVSRKARLAPWSQVEATLGVEWDIGIGTYGKGAHG